jgi:hypothetical protein
MEGNNQQIKIIDTRQHNEREFLGVWIPREIYLAEKLSWTEIILLTEITSLDTDEKGCFASNRYLADFIRIKKETSISRMVKKLKKMNLIWEENFDGRHRILHSNVKAALAKMLRQPSPKRQGSLRQNANHINKGINKDNKPMPTKVGEKVFSLKEKLTAMTNDKRRHIKIIAFYWQFQNIQPQNQQQYQALLKRDLRGARDLTGFSNEQIKKTANWLRQNTDFKWTLETILKYISEDLSKNNQVIKIK